MPRQLSDREKSFLKILNAKPSINSGATFGDTDGFIEYYIADDVAVEVKATDAKSFSIKKETWDKTAKQASRIGKVPMLAVDIQKTRLIILDINDYLTLIDRLERTKNEY